MPGVCVLGDRAKTEGHDHGCPGCPHNSCMGPAVSASANVFVNGIPALRLGDVGIHTACCGPAMWKVIQASGALFINGSPAVRKGDLTLHCSITMGKMIDASGDVNDFSPLGAVVALGPPLDPSILQFYKPEPHFGVIVGPGASDILHMPPGVNLESNIGEARKNALGLTPGLLFPANLNPVGNAEALLWFYNRVHHGGSWDYRTHRGPQYDDFGNFHYGVVGKAMGIPDQILLRAAGLAQEHDHSRGGKGSPVAPVGRDHSSYGDRPRNQFWIKKGIDFYEEYEKRHQTPKSDNGDDSGIHIGSITIPVIIA